MVGVSADSSSPSIDVHIGERQYLIADNGEDLSVLVAVAPTASRDDLAEVLEDVEKEALEWGIRQGESA